jgi:hypothetical protein
MKLTNLTTMALSTMILSLPTTYAASDNGHTKIRPMKCSRVLEQEVPCHRYIRKHSTHFEIVHRSQETNEDPMFSILQPFDFHFTDSTREGCYLDRSTLKIQGRAPTFARSIDQSEELTSRLTKLSITNKNLLTFDNHSDTDTLFINFPMGVPSSEEDNSLKTFPVEIVSSKIIFQRGELTTSSQSMTLDCQIIE